jgi:hypothetical protein
MTLVFAFTTPWFVNPSSQLRVLNPHTSIFPNPWTLSSHRIQNARLYPCLFNDTINSAGFISPKICCGLRNTWEAAVLTEFEILSRHFLAGLSKTIQKAQSRREIYSTWLATGTSQKSTKLLTTFWSVLATFQKICEKQLWASSCQSVRPSVVPRSSTRLPLDRFVYPE